MDYSGNCILSDLQNEDKESIGEYINYNKVDNKVINKAKIKRMLPKNKKLFKLYDQFIKNLNELNDNKMTPNINEIMTNFEKNKLYCIEVGIILDKDLINLKKNLFFDEIKELNNSKENFDEEEYNKLEENYINKLIKKVDINIINFIENIELFDPQKIDDNKRKRNIYNLINLDLLKNISNSQQFLENLDSLYKCYFLINNKEDLILFPNIKRLYKIDYNNKNFSFQLNPYDSNSECEDILQNLKGLYENEQNIITQLKQSLPNILKAKQYYLVKTEWIKEYKRIYNYENIVNNIRKKDRELLSYLENEKISNYCKKQEHLNPPLNKDISEDFAAPFNFQIIDKQLFENILKIINDKNNIELKTKFLFDISFGDNKIIVKEEWNSFNIYYIYSFIDEKYELQYILKLNNGEDINSIFSKC